MRFTLLALQLAHVFSLDVFCIAFAWCSLVLGEISGKAIEIWQPLVISCSVWIAYTIDRLKDGKRLDRSRPHWSRHMIHYRYGKVLWACLALVFSAVAFVIQSSASFVQFCVGLSLTGLVALYFWLHGRGCKDTTELWRPVAVGCLFSCGVCLPTLLNAGFEVQTVVVMFGLGTLFTFNTISVAWLERGIDDLQSGSGGGRLRFWKRIVVLTTIALYFAGLVSVIGFINFSSVFKLAYLGAAFLLALNLIAFSTVKIELRGSLQESAFVPYWNEAGDSTRGEHVGSCFAEAALWVPAVVALCWGA